MRPELRRRGVGRELVRASLRWMAARGLRRVNIASGLLIGTFAVVAIASAMVG